MYSHRNAVKLCKGGRSSVSDLGNRLREARESKGLSLADVEEATRIRRGFLGALEEERFAELPAPIYARGFIRTYSAFLGLDPEPLLQRYTSAVGPEGAPEPLMLDEPLTRRVGPGLGATVFLALMVLLVFAGVGWYSYNRFYLGVDPFAPLAQTRAAAAQATATLSAGAVVAATTPAVTPQSATQAAEGTRPAGATLPAPTSLYTPTATPVTPTPTRATTAVPTPTAIQGVLVAAEVIAPTYIEVTVDGVESFVGTLQLGDTPTWQGDERVNLRLGNAGGISLTVNGVDVGHAGGPRRGAHRGIWPGQPAPAIKALPGVGNDKVGASAAAAFLIGENHALSHHDLGLPQECSGFGDDGPSCCARPGTWPWSSPDAPTCSSSIPAALSPPAREESYAALAELAAHKSRGQRLVAAGCLAQRYGDEIRRVVPEVDAVIGTRSWPEIVTVLEQLGGPPSSADLLSARADLVRSVRRSASGPSAYVKIADGCDAACAFCAIPLIKGPQQSKPLADVGARGPRAGHGRRA